jgi:hypothetical protein
MLAPLATSQPVDGPLLENGVDERIATPGATRSGFIRSDSGDGAIEENDAIAVLVRSAAAAPTAIARAALPGELIEPSPSSAPEFPAEATGTTPAAAAAFSASARTSRLGSISCSPRDKLITSMPSATAASTARAISGALPLRPTVEGTVITR